MQTIRILHLLLAIAACSCGGSKENDNTGATQTVSISPAALSCSDEAQTLTIQVNASGPFQTYAADGVTWVSVEPSYSTESSAPVKVTVKKNDTYQERSTEITVK